MTASKYPPLLPGHYYHIYNRGNNRENLFKEARNYRYFLDLYAERLLPIIDLFAYCLMINHFHLLVRVKGDLDNYSEHEIENRVGTFFGSYTKAVNKRYGRTGSLFEGRFKRIRVDTDRYFYRLVPYIHHNPQTHGFTDKFDGWKWSSYRTLLSDKPTNLCRDETLSWFGGIDGFVEAHESFNDGDEIAHLTGNDTF